MSNISITSECYSPFQQLFSTICSDETFWKRRLESDFNFTNAETARTSGWKFIYRGLFKPRGESKSKFLAILADSHFSLRLGASISLDISVWLYVLILHSNRSARVLMVGLVSQNRRYRQSMAFHSRRNLSFLMLVLSVLWREECKPEQAGVRTQEASIHIIYFFRSFHALDSDGSIYVWGLPFGCIKSPSAYSSILILGTLNGEAFASDSDGFSGPGKRATIPFKLEMPAKTRSIRWVD